MTPRTFRKTFRPYLFHKKVGSLPYASLRSLGRNLPTLPTLPR